MCTLYLQGKAQAQSVSSTSNSQQGEDFSSGLETVLGQVWVGSPYKAICIPANSVKVVKGKTSKIARRLSWMIEARSQNNLPMGVCG